MEVFMGKSTINGPCSMAMLNNQRVNWWDPNVIYAIQFFMIPQWYVGTFVKETPLSINSDVIYQWWYLNLISNDVNITTVSSKLYMIPQWYGGRLMEEPQFYWYIVTYLGLLGPNVIETKVLPSIVIDTKGYIDTKWLVYVWYNILILLSTIYPYSIYFGRYPI